MAKKPKLGQNFLVDEDACLSIAEALGDASSRTVVEIGPGHGAITRLLARRVARLHCIEFDPALARELEFHFRNEERVTVHHADILNTDLSTFLDGAGSLDVVGNLPYYITSEILLRLFAAARDGVVARAVLMMQREVAERIAAAPGSSEYGALSALTQMHAQTIRLYERLGLVTPQRKSKNRLYSESDVERLRQIRRFTQEMGVNLAGVEVILELLGKMEQLQAERDALVDRSNEIEARVREYLTRTGGKFP